MSGGVKYVSDKNVDELIANHRNEIDELKKACASSLPDNGVLEDGLLADDIFLLRYLLSNKNDVGVCTKKVTETIEWRTNNASMLRELQEIKDGVYVNKHPLEERMSKYLFSGATGVLAGGEPVNVIRLGQSDCKALVELYSINDIADYMTFEKAVSYHQCDRATRETRRLVKAISVIDFDGFNMFGSKFDKRIMSAMGDSSKSASVFFPQLQVKTVAMNTPAFTGMIKKLLSAVLPKSSMEKMVICSGKTASQKITSCPFSQTYGMAQAVPPFLGGTAVMPDCLKTPSEREHDEALAKYRDSVANESSGPEDVPYQTVIVENRSYSVISSPMMEENSTICFEVSVEDKHIRFSAEVLPSNLDIVPPSPASSSRKTRSSSVEIVKRLGRLTNPKRSPRDRPVLQRTRSNSLGNPVTHYGEEDDDTSDEEHDRHDTGLASPPSTGLSNPGMLPVRVAVENGLVKGSWEVPVAGRVIFKLDNSFSKLRTKKVTFRCWKKPKAIPMPIAAIQDTGIPTDAKTMIPVFKLLSELPMVGTLIALLFILAINRIFSLLVF